MFGLCRALLPTVANQLHGREVLTYRLGLVFRPSALITEQTDLLFASPIAGLLLQELLG